MMQTDHEDRRPQGRRKDTEQRIDVVADLDVVLSPVDAARFLGVAPDTLYRWRKRGGGPRYTRLANNLIGYRKRRLLEYLDAREFESTSAETVAGTTAEDREGED